MTTYENYVVKTRADKKEQEREPPALRRASPPNPTAPAFGYADKARKLYFFLRFCVAFCAKSVILSNTAQKGALKVFYFKSWQAVVALVIIACTLIAHALGAC